MTFLQPFLLLSLPLIALPLVIHLINQHRHRTVRWAATMFLLQARRMTRGMAKLRYWLILMARMLAIAGLILAVSRPMAGGWLGWSTGTVPESTIIVLDRSVSMETSDGGSGVSRRQAAVQKLSTLLADLGRNAGLLLFDAATGTHRPLTSPSDLTDIPETQATSTATDMPQVLQSVADYITTHETGRTDIWICSDLQQSDWDPDSGLWSTFRSQLKERDGIRLFLLTYPEATEKNFAVRISGVHRREASAGAELVMDLEIRRTAGVSAVNPDGSETVTGEIQAPPATGASTEAPAAAETIPVTFVIDGARSVMELEIRDNLLVRNGHTIPVDRGSENGWGYVSLPQDANPSDNQYRFVFGDSAVQRAVIVADDPDVAELLSITASSTPDRSHICEAIRLTSVQAETYDFDQTSLVLWQSQLPKEPAAASLEKHVQTGGSLMFFPPTQPDQTTFMGTQWTSWSSPEGTSAAFPILRWRTDDDLLASVRSGSPLPVGQLMVHQYCGVAHRNGSVVPLAQLDGGHSLLSLLESGQGRIWFCGTLPSPAYSNFISNGVTFYVMIQRALSGGSARAAGARQLECRDLDPVQSGQWEPVDDLSASIPVSRRPTEAGIYRANDSLIAINRPLSEDHPEVISDAVLDELLQDLEFTRINDLSGEDSTLASEIWRVFLMIMIFGLMAEALLCVPDRPAPQPAARAT